MPWQPSLYEKSFGLFSTLQLWSGSSQDHSVYIVLYQWEQNHLYQKNTTKIKVNLKWIPAELQEQGYLFLHNYGIFSL